MTENFQAFLDIERDKINQGMNAYFKKLIGEEEEPYLRKFLTHSHNFSKGPGRRLLPICLVNTFIGLSSDKQISEYLEDIYKISISIELLHISTLVIDDLIDNEEIRRGLPTFHKSISDIEDLNREPSKTNIATINQERILEYESSSAIYGGNLTSLLGSRIILDSKFDVKLKQKAINIYIAGLEGMTRGYLLDEHYKLRPLDQITLEDYLILSSLKRGKQMETAVGIGAILGNARKSQMEPLMQAMNKMGIIEQLINDVEGSFGDPSEKSIDADIRSGQCTILTVIAYQSADKGQRKALDSILGKSDASTEEISKIREIYRATGALNFVKLYSDSLKNDVQNLLKRVYPGLKAKNMHFSENLLSYLTKNPNLTNLDSKT
ncbi:MAG: polyprenyl synthetase family protein [Promethearchaeota archaeon]